LNVNGVSVGSQTEIHTVWQLMHEPSAFGVEMAIEKQERDKSLGIDQSQQN